MAEKPAAPAAGSPAGDGAGDPSMEDILASIRRILNEDEKAAAGDTPPPAFPVAAAIEPLPTPAPIPALAPEPAPEDGVVMLDPSMLVGAPQPPPTEASPPPPAPDLPLLPPLPATADGLIDPLAAAAAASSVGALMRTLAAERGTAVHRGGPTIEDLVREEVRPLLKQWLDSHLPSLVERAVRTEIERVIGRSYS